MKVAPILFRSKTLLTRNNSGSTVCSPVSFKSDSFGGYHIYDDSLNRLKNDVNDLIIPYIEKFGDRYNKIGLMGIELQTFVQEFEKLNNSYFMKDDLDSKKYPIFNKCKAETASYNEYLNNIREYNQIKKLGKNPNYETPQIKEKIVEANVIMTQNNSIFANQKELYDVYEQSLLKIREKTSDITIEKQMPDIYKRLKLTNDTYYSALGVFMQMGVDRARRLKNETDILTHSKEPPYEKMVKSEKLLREADSLKHNIKFTNENEKEVDDFINGFPKENLLSIQELKDAYSQLNKKKDDIVKSYAEKLTHFYEKSYLDKGQEEKIKDILSSQKKINEEIWSLINESKQKYIEKCNEDFIKNFSNNNPVV